MLSLARAGTTCRLFAIAAVALSCLVPRGHAQPCDAQWLPGDSVPGTNGPVHASTMWDPDGEGPEEPLLVLGGLFKVAGDAYADGVVAYNPSTKKFSALGSGIRGTVYTLATMPNGDVVAGGFFLKSNGMNAQNHILRWDGETWAPMTTFMDFAVTSLVVLPSGDLAVGGYFRTIGTQNIYRLARWSDETRQWSSMGSANLDVNAMALLPNGDLVVAGEFTTISSVAVKRIARNDRMTGTWHPIGDGFSSEVESILVLPDGELVVGGTLGALGPVARWDGAAWSKLGTGLSFAVVALHMLPDGSIVAGGAFGSSSSGGELSRWNGTVWSKWAGGTTRAVRRLVALPDGKVLVGGHFHSLGGVVASRVALWNGTGWEPLSSGSGGLSDHSVYAVEPVSGGGFVAAGEFAMMGGTPTAGIAMWNGVRWTPLDSGLDSYANAVTTLPNGDIVVGGAFSFAGGEPARGIARWDGSSWHALGSGLYGTVYAVKVASNGDLIAGGSFVTAGGETVNRIARWDGASWSALGTGVNGTVYSLAFLQNGDLVAGGSFTEAGGVAASRIARWDGTTWSQLGPGFNDIVYALHVGEDGGLVAGGQFSVSGTANIYRVARWDGAAWHPLGAGFLDSGSKVFAITSRWPGDIVAAGRLFVGSEAEGHVAYWNGSGWSHINSGFNTYAHALAISSSGELIAGGEFSRSSQTVTALTARWTGTNIPWVALQPASGEVDADDTLVLTATPANGYANLSVQWKRNGVDIVDGAGGASIGGGTVSGASGAMPSPADGTPATLMIAGARPSDSGEYVAVFSNACGENSSAVAMVSVVDRCDADYNRDTIGGDELDFLDFIQDFAACDQQPAPCGTLGTPDINGDTIIDILDLLDFFEAFAAGC